MVRKYLLPLLAIVGAIFGLLSVYKSQKTVPVPPIIFPPPTSPYPYAIAGAGIIEASSKNIAIGSPFDEIVTKIFVTIGQQVKSGDPLFQLDLRSFEAQLASAEAQLNSALTTLRDKQTQYSFYQRLKDTRAVSEQQYQQAYYAVLEAEEAVKINQANIKIFQTNIERSIIRAPIDGEILQVNVNLGEIAPIFPVGSSQAEWNTVAKGTLMLMGDVTPLQIRVDINEEDAWRFEPNTAATAFVRGNSFINFPLKYKGIEPYIVPKSSFTGETVERVDTRVLQVLYQFDKNNLPVYAGQVLDVFIESKPITAFVEN